MDRYFYAGARLPWVLRPRMNSRQAAARATLCSRREGPRRGGRRGVTTRVLRARQAPQRQHETRSMQKQQHAARRKPCGAANTLRCVWNSVGSVCASADRGGAEVEARRLRTQLLSASRWHALVLALQRAPRLRAHLRLVALQQQPLALALGRERVQLAVPKQQARPCCALRGARKRASRQATKSS